MSVENLERETTDVALVAVPQGEDAFRLFTAKETAPADRILAMVRSKIDAFKAKLPDATTPSGRKEIASFAFKIAKSKTAIEEVGAALAKEAKDIPKRIDANRKHIKDTLDAWRDEVRQPVTDWENAEEARVNAIKDRLAAVQREIDDREERTAQYLKDTLADIADIDCDDEAAFGEYSGAAAELKAQAIEILTGRVAAAERREAEAAELARLRAESEARAKKDREEQIAREAAEKAKQEVLAAARAAEAAASQREAELKAAVAKAAEDKRLAEERAVKAAQEAKEQAERAIREKQEAEDRERQAREASTKHRAAINRAALQALVDGRIDEATAKNVIKLIASGKVPNVTISY